MTAFLRATGLATILLCFGSAARAQEVLTVVLTGQSMIRSDLRATAPDTVAAIRPLLTGNVVFTNLEGAIAMPGQSAQEGRGFLAPPESLDALQGLGFNLLALAGNHAFDLGRTGVENTLRESARRNLARAGIGTTLNEAAAPAYLHVGNMTIALVASASGLINPVARATPEGPGVNELRVNAGTQPNEATADLPGAPANTPESQDARRILDSIRTAKQHADLVIVYQHNHVFGNRSFSTLFSEGMSERLAPNQWLRNWVHQEVEAGADIVVMHGAPLLHAVELFHGHPIFYDLGNFIYNLPPTLTYIDEPIAWESVVAHLQFQGVALQSITLTPLILNRIGRGQPDVHDPHTNNEFLDTRGLPARASGAQATYILDRLAQLSAPLGTKVQVDGETARIDLTGHSKRGLPVPAP
ncbi:MAG TPA: CapA family protein [Steroidobacteraceae bacterium]|jgi:poly-gamma-glutamate synthesis protein (capsule biosynthesis protein)